jgi:hypothetical protein
MLECGFQKKPCNDKCALFIKGTKECAIVSIAALLEGVHNISVLAHDKYIKTDPYDDFEEDPLAAALIAESKEENKADKKNDDEEYDDDDEEHDKK